MNEDNIFTWQFPVPGQQGFAWVECHYPDEVPSSAFASGLALVQRDDVPFISYRPMALPVALHRAFAEVEPTEQGILEFANQFGRLGEGAQQQAEIQPTPGIDRTSAFVEPFEYWQHRLAWAREAIRVWDLIQDGATEELADVIRWEGKDRVYYKPPPAVVEALELPPPNLEKIPIDLPADLMRKLKEHGEKHREQTIWSRAQTSHEEPDCRPGDVVKPAILWLHGTISGTLRLTAAPALLWDVDHNRSVLQDVPRSLLGAVYLQLAAAVYGKRTPRRCQVCGRWFELAPGLNRSDRLTCSNTCRTRAYRQRQDRARQLAAQGKTFKTIAKELGADTATVKKWVTNRKG
jgi:hypothetical protein